jgi:hypothetical protein
MAQVEKKHRVTYDSSGTEGFIVHKDNGETQHFKKAKSGMFYMDVAKREGTALLVTTVEDNKSRYTSRAYKLATEARRIQDAMWKPSTRNYTALVKSNEMENCPITTHDITAAEDIFGPNLGSLRGKTVRQSVDHIRTPRMEIPRYVLEKYRDVTLCTDIML